MLDNLRKLESKRTEKQVQKYRAQTPNNELPGKGEKIRLLLEIVSGIDLPVADVSSTDPYIRHCAPGLKRSPPHQADFHNVRF